MIIKNYPSKAKCLIVGILLSTTVLAAGAKPPANFIKEGVWRGEFSVSESKIPFNFELKGKDPDHAVFTLTNGSRRDNFQVKRLGADSIYIKLNTYDAALFVKIEDDGHLSGDYRSLVPGFKSRPLHFIAEYGKNYRFVEPGKDVGPKANITGKWELKISSKDSIPNKIALFKQTGNKLTGVIMQVTGDSGELEGTVQGNEFILSSFIGPSPKLYKGHINDDGTISGELDLIFYDNSRFDITRFDGVKDDKAELPDLYKFTYLKTGYNKLDFTFPDLNGKPVSLSDDKYKGKVTIIEILGSWCPNCIDQTVFLSPWFNKNKNRGLEAIAVAFELKDDLKYAQYTLGKLRDKYHIQYDILFGGSADKKQVSQKLPALSKVVAFPTTIIIDKKGNVREIHTGYTGAVTGKYYQDYEKKFNQL